MADVEKRTRFSKDQQLTKAILQLFKNVAGDRRKFVAYAAITLPTTAVSAIRLVVILQYH